MANTSITVTFVTEAENLDVNAVLQVQLDSTLNLGETRFLFGSKAYYQVFFSPSTMTITQTASDGNITEEGSGTEEVTEYITFANSNEGSTGYPIGSVVSAEWFGTNLGALSYIGNTVQASKSGVGILKLIYNSAFNRYAISVQSTGDSEYYVLVYIAGTV